MAATFKKHQAGSGFFEVVIGTDRAADLSGKTTIVIVRVNKAAYDGLSANGKADIDAVTIANMIAQAFS